MRKDRSLEQIVFPVPRVCHFLTQESQYKVMQKTECNEQGSKVDDFFKQINSLHEEMVSQKDLRGKTEGTLCDMIVTTPFIVSFNLSC